MKKVFITYLFLCQIAFSFAQEKGIYRSIISHHSSNTISLIGLVLDKDSKDTVPFVSVKFYNNSDTLRTGTDFDGKFVFHDLYPGSYYIQLSSVGHKEFDTIIQLNTTNNNIVFHLLPVKFNMELYLISATRAT